MVGKIYTALFPYFNSETKKHSYKQRPVLVISEAINNDYLILPVSTITNKENIHPEFDIKIDPKIYPKLNLNKSSYIRTHRQTSIYKAMLVFEISDLRKEYPSIYEKVIYNLNKFNQRVIHDLDEINKLIVKKPNGE
ncbi:type II toxin-antitoxin system PemK/MazF family toxin [Pseudostreptobacillus hongkongensis]|uniref:type II toxin-antitoxin system PemK/MazF family toxin n=1 Tax=Pseudostreptobacillus hongkongensis TaxID=1162717 RepID=UPI000834154D|nr:type II toxin-antitoxin system PemK/MazF family toxin [Pseudostreptobacillus hongkongensis]